MSNIILYKTLQRTYMSILITIKVSPSSSRQSCTIDKSGHLKCFLKSPPEKGRANDELIKLLSKALNIPQTDITLVTGHSSRTKRLNIKINLTYDQLLSSLGIEQQKSLLKL